MAFLKNNMKRIAIVWLLIVFLGQYLLMGVKYAPDTAAYEAFSVEVYPIYPTVLFLFRLPFGAEIGYIILGVCQNVFLVVSIYSLLNYLKEVYRLEVFYYFLLAFILAAVFIVQVLFTHTKMITSNTLISEALSIPFYFLFFRYSLETFIERTVRPFIYSCLFAVCLVLTRGQLYWVLVIIFMNGVRLAGLRRWRAVLAGILACLIVTCGVQGTRYLQTAQTEDNQKKNPVNFFILSTAVYCSDSEDSLLFEANSGESRLFKIARDYMDDPEYLAGFSYESGNLTARHEKFEANYDRLKSILKKNYEVLKEEGFDISVGYMMRILIFENLGAFLLHCAQNALVGLIRTVAILKPGINVCAFIFLGCMALCPLIFRKNKALTKEKQLICLALLCTMLNVLIMSPSVFALSRYMFYNLPILYIAAVLMFRGLFDEYVKKHIEKKLIGEKNA